MKTLLTEKEVQKAIEKIAASILKAHSPFFEILLVGIQTRGVILAQKIKEQLDKKLKSKVALGSLDINLYRDDISTASKIPVMKKTEIPISIENWGVILVDDVLYTGRTIRSAMDALIDFGRPRFIELAVLVDRGGRELPIQPNYVSLTYPARPDENIKVCFEETDEAEKVLVLKDGYSEKRKVVLA